MKNRSQLIYVLIGAFVLLTAFRETIAFDFNLCKTTSSAEASANWIDGSKVLTPTNNIGKSDISVIVIFDKDTLYKELKAAAPVIVKVNSLQIGRTWVPLYKSIKYSAKASVKDKKTKNGILSTNGKIEITGTCSSKQAADKVKAAAAETFANQVKSRLSAINQQGV